MNSVRKDRRRSYPVCRPRAGAPAGGFAGSGAITRLAPPTGAPASKASLPCLFESLRATEFNTRAHHASRSATHDKCLTPYAKLLTIKSLFLYNTQTFRKSKHNRCRQPLAKMFAIGQAYPYGGAPVTGLTHLLYEVCASRKRLSLHPVYSFRLRRIKHNHCQTSLRRIMVSSSHSPLPAIEGIPQNSAFPTRGARRGRDIRRQTGRTTRRGRRQPGRQPPPRAHPHPVLQSGPPGRFGIEGDRQTHAGTAVRPRVPYGPPSSQPQ